MTMVIRNLTTAVSVAALTLAWSSPSAAAQARMFDIPAQPAATAIGAFGRQAGIEIIAAHALVADKQANRVAGDFGTEQALDQLLRGTGLTFRKVSEHAYRVAALTPAEAPQPQPFRETSVAAAETAPASSEIVVTAQKREERLRDVPVPVTALATRQLAAQNLNRIQDYYTQVPGLSLSTSSAGDEKVISIRGITTGGGNPTVGIVIDDVAYGASSAYTGGGIVPDLDPSDLERVEVLRGPQGTLYGAASIGGLLKFVTVDPSTSGVSGRVSAGFASVAHGGAVGGNFRGSINLPITDTIAVRASAFTRVDPGYIDNIKSGIDNVNRARVSGGRIAVLWKFAPDFSLKLGALVQDYDLRGSNWLDINAVDQLHQSDFPGTGYSHRHIENYNATLKGRIAGIDLISVTGYGRNRLAHGVDESQALGGAAASIYGPGNSGVPMDEHSRTRKFSEELRLSSSIGEHVDWLAGAYYTNEKSFFAQTMPVVNVTTLQTIVDPFLYAEIPTTFREFAVFGDLTVKLGDRFDIQFGGRKSWNKQHYAELDGGPFVPLLIGVPDPLINPQVVTKDGSFTYLITPRFKVNADLMIYGRIATGYRVGGPNPTATVFNLPLQFAPDKTQNFEIGAKGRLFDRRLGFDLSVYHIRWTNIQLSLNDPGSGAAFYGNASEAASNGVEGQFDLRAWRGMTFTANATYNDAHLTKAFPATAGVFGVKGAQLPFTAKFSGSIGAEQQFPLSDQATGLVGATLTHVGTRYGEFIGSVNRQEYPAYTQVDLHAGVNLKNGLGFALFANNLTDRRGLLTGGLGSNQKFSIQIIQPRTIGGSVSKTF